ncbi:MAG: deoxyhypusine synthase [Thermoplasmata archaeon]|nr:MAG: deoxyhypusine synthase [Thermoplasmata archaeon]
MKKEELLKEEIEHIDIKDIDSTSIIEAFEKMSFQARNLANAASIYDKMLMDNDCTIILSIAGSLFSAGLKKVVRDLVRHDMVDVIVSTGAIMVDQDFFAALGFKHYKGTPIIDDEMLRELMIDRIYDTFIDEEQLRTCDITLAEIADSLEPRPYSSQEFLWEIGRYLHMKRKDNDSVVLECYRKNLPIFVPAFSDCSAGFGLVYHQHKRGLQPKVTIDSVKDFLDLTKIKYASKETGLVMIGGGVPKNFAQDITVAAEILGADVGMHKYAIQITVADERDGGLSGSTLKEAHSWGKVDNIYEQMVFSEATIAFPLIASYVYHKNNWTKRQPKCYAKMLKEIME